MDIIELFVPYELAVLAKEKGFKDECLSYWCEEPGHSPFLKFNEIQDHEDDLKSLCAAPLYQQIVEWFRSEHKIEVQAASWKEGRKIIYMYSVHFIETKKSRYQLKFTFETYKDALTKAIEEAFKLI